MKKTVFTVILAFVAALSMAMAQDAPAAAAPPATHAVAAPAAAKPAPITDAQRFKAKQLEAQYYQLQNSVTQAQTAQLAGQVAQEKMGPIRTELQQIYQAMQASCSKDQTFDDQSLACKGTESAAASTPKK